MSVLVSDPDFVLHVGDVREELATMQDGSVDCVVTSPPYWGLRDYGTGVWDGGSPDCDHRRRKHDDERSTGGTFRNSQRYVHENDTHYDNTCGKCGARRQDQQLGLEPTPDAYITNMVAVFREVKRVLADHGTCWVNIGDSYASVPGGQTQGANGQMADRTVVNARAQVRDTKAAAGMGAPQRPPGVSGLKPKDLVGIPWKLAFALQADGWYLRADIIWAKPNPMPESVTDRPTKSHEYVFLLSKRPRYWFDQEAVREPHVGLPGGRFGTYPNGTGRHDSERSRPLDNPAGRNVRSVWEIATQPYAEAHFATYPEELVRRCVLAGCPVRVCRSCGRPSERIVDAEGTYGDRRALGYDKPANMKVGVHEGHHNVIHPPGMTHDLTPKFRKDLGWSDCGHDTWRVGAVLDPFLGSGTTALVARKHGRRCVGIELNPEYAELAVRRNAQQTIWA